MPRTTRRPIETQKSPLALRIGTRLRAARLKAGLTQQQLAGERYTKAYVSALENALIKPSMVALDYLAGRLGTTASHLMADQGPVWSRLAADLHLAAGNWQAALDAYGDLAERASDMGTVAELRRGESEALVRLDRGAEAVGAATQAVELFESLGRQADAALASYWLAASQYQQDNTAESRAILQALLEKVRKLEVDEGLRLRLLMALATVEAREGNHETALNYLEEIQALAHNLDDRQRAVHLFDLAYRNRDKDDLEAALRAGYGSLALFEAAGGRVELASLENDLALAYVGLGELERASEMAAAARRHFTQLGAERMLAHVTETEAQIEAARGDWAGSLRLADDAVAAAERVSDPSATVSALLTRARALTSLDRTEEAKQAYERAAGLARSMSRPALRRRVLTEWAEFLAQSGDHRAAYALTREALGSHPA
jgi:transcriptional regulator with XRE-family HTH domain